LYAKRTGGGAENTGVENEAPDSKGGNILQIRRPKTKWHMLNKKRIKACTSLYNNGAFSRMQFVMLTAWLLTQRHCVPLQAAAEKKTATRIKRMKRRHFHASTF